MARVFTCGFEQNTVTAAAEWNVIGTSTTIQSSVVRSGGFAGGHTSLLSGDARGYLTQWRATAANGPFWFRFYFRYHTLPSAANVIFTTSGGTLLTNAQAADIAIKLTSTGTLQLFDNTQVGSDSAALSVDTWYCIEVRTDKAPADGSEVAEARIDGVVFATASNRTLNRTVRSAAFGGNLFFEAQTVGEWYFDDIAINDGGGSFQNGYPGPGKVIHLLPDASGDANTFATQTGGTAGAGNNFTRVDEVTPDDATTFNGSATLNEEDMFNCGASGIGASDVINVVQVGGRFRNSTADTTAAVRFQIKKTAAGTVSQSASIVPNATAFKTNATATPQAAPIVLYQDPDAAAWTQSTLDSMQIGYKLQTAPAVGGRRVDVSTVWAIVDYTPAAAPSTPIGRATIVRQAVTRAANW